MRGVLQEKKVTAMATKRHSRTADPTPEQVEQALEAFRRGRPEESDRLLGEEEGEGLGGCQMLALLVREAGCPPLDSRRADAKVGTHLLGGQEEPLADPTPP